MAVSTSCRSFRVLRYVVEYARQLLAFLAVTFTSQSLRVVFVESNRYEKLHLETVQPSQCMTTTVFDVFCITYTGLHTRLSTGSRPQSEVPHHSNKRLDLGNHWLLTQRRRRARDQRQFYSSGSKSFASPSERSRYTSYMETV